MRAEQRTLAEARRERDNPPQQETTKLKDFWQDLKKVGIPGIFELEKYAQPDFGLQYKRIEGLVESYKTGRVSPEEGRVHCNRIAYAILSQLGVDMGQADPQQAKKISDAIFQLLESNPKEGSTTENSKPPILPQNLPIKKEATTPPKKWWKFW